ncbi:CBS domain-containing protein [Aliiruegeria lutimaris]|uniref:CBS domain-containing protein n=2 Tax=Aliiruegeria lutimaris TaxID=571298 RepID=A0A1G9DEX0_9RHOB|nr:CBS domain-containing protein [Aliiruegeria lutimaris]
MMAEHGVGALAVVEGDRLVGILSERDIVFRGVGAGEEKGQTLVSEIMTAAPVTVDIEDPISDALAMKLGNAFRHLPVMEEGRLVGLLSYRDIPTEYVILYERFREMSGANSDK